jgi:hypothetical protein
MSFFERFFGDKTPKGVIGYLKLGDWWMSELTSEERDFLALYSRHSNLVVGNVETSETAVSFLSNLAYNIKNRNKNLGIRLLSKAEELLPTCDKIEHVHFFWQVLIELFYSMRQESDTAIQIVKEACLEQIRIAPQSARFFKKEYPKHELPGHMGFHRLIQMEYKNANFVEAIRLAEIAFGQGWRGDWNAMIEKCLKKINGDSKRSKISTIK